MSDEAKTIRDYDINQTNPFKSKKRKSSTPYLSKNRALSVSIVREDNSRNLTGIHKINKGEALDLIGDILKDKLGITKGGVLVFKYLFQNQRKRNAMTFKVDFDHCKDEIGWISTQSVWYGIAELLDKEIVARSGVPGVYFLNPNFFLPTQTIIISEFYKLKE